MAKVSKNAKAAQRSQATGSKDYVMVVKPIKNEKTGKYSYKTQMVHKDKVNEILSTK